MRGTSTHAGQHTDRGLEQGSYLLTGKILNMNSSPTSPVLWVYTSTMYLALETGPCTRVLPPMTKETAIGHEIKPRELFQCKITDMKIVSGVSNAPVDEKR